LALDIFGSPFVSASTPWGHRNLWGRHLDGAKEEQKEQKEQKEEKEEK